MHAGKLLLESILSATPGTKQMTQRSSAREPFQRLERKAEISEFQSPRKEVQGQALSASCLQAHRGKRWQVWREQQSRQCKG